MPAEGCRRPHLGMLYVHPGVLIILKACTCLPLTGVLGLWAVCCAKSEAADGTAPASAPQPHHSYLVMSFKDGTKLLATGDELREATDV